MSYIQNEYYHLVSYEGRGACLNVYGDEQVTPNRNVCLWDWSDFKAQRWAVKPVYGMLKIFTALDGDYALNIWRGSTNRYNCDITRAAGNDADSAVLLEPVNTSGNIYRIKLKNYARYLTAQGGVSGDNVSWEPLADSPAQKWMLAMVKPALPPLDGRVKGCDIATPFDDTPLKHETMNKIAASGRRFVGRYLTKSDTSWKLLTASEARRIHAHGLQIISFYQEGNTEPSSFTFESGKEQAESALLQARKVGMPKGLAIYFAVDFNPTAKQIQESVIPYFEGVNTILKRAQYEYRAGVYGSGLVCQTIKQDKALAGYSYLAKSSGYRGTAEYNDPAKYDVKQMGTIVINQGAPHEKFDDGISGNSVQFGQW